MLERIVVPISKSLNLNFIVPTFFTQIPMIRYTEYKFSRAVITKYHILGDLNNKFVFSQF